MKKNNKNWFFIVGIGLFYCISAAVILLAIFRESVTLNSLSNLRLVIFILLAPILLKYFVQLCVAPFYSVFEKFRKRRSFEETPLVSVIIPAYNEEMGIIKTLTSVLDNYYEKLEIILVNDGSTDNTHHLIKAFLRMYKKNQFSKPVIHYLKLENGGKAHAMNKGLSLARGELIVTVDADSVMDRHTITNFVKRFNEPKVGAVAGNVIVGNKSKPLEVIQQLEYLYGFYFKRADSIFNSVYIIGGAAAAYRRSVLLQVGGFDHKIITEDIEMSTRILAHGFKTRYANDAIVYTEGPSEWSGLCNQRLRWKFGRLLTFIKHRKLFFSLDKKHSPYLTCLLLPLAVYSEFTLLIEAPLLLVFYGYTILASDYLPLAFVIVFMTSLISLQVLFDPKARFHSNLLGLAPIAWIVFYIIDVVEFQALTRSLVRLVKRENLKWQKWVRAGVLN